MNPSSSLTLHGHTFDELTILPPGFLGLDWSIIGSASQTLDIKNLRDHFNKVKDLPIVLQDNLLKLFLSFSDCFTKAIEWSIRYMS